MDITDRNRQKWAEIEKNGQKQTEKDRHIHKLTEKDRNRQKRTETDRNRQIQTEKYIYFFLNLASALLFHCPRICKDFSKERPEYK